MLIGACFLTVCFMFLKAEHSRNRGKKRTHQRCLLMGPKNWRFDQTVIMIP